MIALDQARALGTRWRSSTPWPMATRAGNLSLMSEMLQGVATGALFLHHQPKLDLRSGAITGVEALVRWDHRRRAACCVRTCSSAWPRRPATSAP